jgi:transketolase C-terminal domain/subunit
VNQPATGANHQEPVVVVLEDHRTATGLYPVVCQLAVSRGTTARVLPIGFTGDGFQPAELDAVLDGESLRGDHVAATIRRSLAT